MFKYTVHIHVSFSLLYLLTEIHIHTHNEPNIYTLWAGNETIHIGMDMHVSKHAQKGKLLAGYPLLLMQYYEACQIMILWGNLGSLPVGQCVVNMNIYGNMHAWTVSLINKDQLHL